MQDIPYFYKTNHEYQLKSNQYLIIQILVFCVHVTIVLHHYSDIIMSMMASQITSLTIVYSTVYSGADQRKHQSSASLAFVWGIHRWPVNSPHKGPVMHDVQFSCAMTQPLLAHHWRVHQCLLTSRFIAPLIPWGVSAPGGKMRKQLLKDYNFLNNSPIFIIESSTLIYLLFKKDCIQYISIWNIVLDLVKDTCHNFTAGCGSPLWANTCSLWSGIKSWPGAGCLQRQVKRNWQ